VRKVNPPTIISALLAASTLSLTILLLTDPAPLAPGSAALVAAGAWLYTLIGIAGVVLVYAPWARWLGLGTAIGELLVAAVVGIESAAAIAIVVIGLAAIAGFAGPWLELWLRRRPGTGPQPRAVALPVVAIGAPVVCGLAAWSGPSVAVIVAAVIGPIAAWAYARSLLTGLWALRLAYPVAAAVAAIGLSPAGAAALLVHGGVVGVLAWFPAAARAQRPVGGSLPAPRYQKGTR
jgi:hypothetical protein